MSSNTISKCYIYKEKLVALRQPDAENVSPDPEDRVTRGMELMEDLVKRIQTCAKAEETREQLFPPEGKKMSKVKKLKMSWRHAHVMLRTQGSFWTA